MIMFVLATLIFTVLNDDSLCIFCTKLISLISNYGFFAVFNIIIFGSKRYFTLATVRVKCVL